MKLFVFIFLFICETAQTTFWVKIEITFILYEFRAAPSTERNLKIIDLKLFVIQCKMSVFQKVFTYNYKYLKWYSPNLFYAHTLCTYVL